MPIVLFAVVIDSNAVICG